MGTYLEESAIFNEKKDFTYRYINTEDRVRVESDHSIIIINISELKNRDKYERTLRRMRMRKD